MKQIPTFLFFLLVLSFGLQAQASPTHNSKFYKQLFYQQLSETCRPNLRWEKSVTDITAGTAKQTKIFDLDCLSGMQSLNGKTSKMKTNEFEHLFQYVYDNPKQADYLNVSETNAESILAMPNPGDEGKTELQFQHFEVKSGKLLEAEAKILKSTPLYDMAVHILVKFDSQGHYLSHTVDTKTSTLMGGDVEAKIEGRLLP